MTLKLFTKEELEELARIDSEIDEDFRETQEDRERSRKLERDARLEALPFEKRKIAENQRAYREANREKIKRNMQEYMRKRRAAEAACD